VATTYRSKGVHTNRHGGKTGRKAITRTGGPYKPKPRTILDTIETTKEAGGGDKALKKTMELVKDKPKESPTNDRMQQLGKALQSASKEAAARDSAATAEFRAGAQADEAAMAQAGASARMGRPGRAAEIIKNRRV
jgi:hypothetical protein